MVKVSTLFHRVDGFDESKVSANNPDLLDQDFSDYFLDKLLSPLVFDPGDKLVQSVLRKIWNQGGGIKRYRLFKNYARSEAYKYSRSEDFKRRRA